MSTPAKKTRVLCETKPFLEQLAAGVLTVDQAKRLATELLQHFPDEHDVVEAARGCDRLDESTARMALECRRVHKQPFAKVF